jgi:hypothetical protein
MTVVVCDACGERYQIGSQFELDGPCRECGEEQLVEEDAYDPAPATLVCTTCRREVQGGGSGGASAGDEWYEGRYSVDDPCPLCDGELVPKDHAAAPRAVPEYTLARRVAERVRHDAGITQDRVDPQQLAEREGLEVVVGAFAHEGMLVDGDKIEVPTRESPNAQRFLIAHELGHALLRHKVPEDRIEREANAFASELLVPRARLKRAVLRGDGFRQMARTFEVSHQALGWALAGAGLTDKVARR